MKHTSILIFFLFIIQLLFSQNRIIDDANALIAQKKYASAYNLLNGADPNNQDPEIAIAKSNLMLNYYLITNVHQAFALRDLALNQELADFRNIDISIPMISFNPDSILNKLIGQYPSNYKLRSALGNYYYEVHISYSNDSWIEPDSVVVEKMRTNYLEAYRHNEFDYWSLFGIGYAYLIKEQYTEAIPYLEKSIEFNPNYALSYYDLAYAYYNIKKPVKSLTLAQKSYELQKIPIYKAEAALLMGEVYESIKNLNKALEYYRLSNKIDPLDFSTLVPLLSLEMAMNKSEYGGRTEELYTIDPENPVVYQEIYKIYKDNKKEKEFIQFLNQQRNNYRNKLLVHANINLYMAIALYETDEWVSAKVSFEKARSLFKNIYPNNHNVFKVINSYTDVIKKK